jgi:hypothetical protein
MTASKIPFPGSEEMAKLPHDQRAVVCLEFIAHYLDRIEGHLKKLSKAAEADVPKPKSAPVGRVIGADFRRP